MAKYAMDRKSGKRVPQYEMPAHYPDMAMAFASSWQDFVAQYLESDEAKAFVTTLWGYLGLPPSRLSGGQYALVLLSYFTGGAWYPTGGSGTMSWAIAEAIEDAGGAVHLRNRVESIVPNDEGAVVTTHTGLRVQARSVVSNASPVATFGMLPEELVEEQWMDELRSEAPSLSSLVVHLAVDRDLAAEGWDHHEFFDMVGYDYEAEYRAILDGRFEEAGMIISNYTVVDPSCAPPGGSVIVLTSLAPWDHRHVWGTGGNLAGYRSNPEYRRIKQEAGDKLIDRAERLIPGLRDCISTGVSRRS